MTTDALHRDDRRVGWLLGAESDDEARGFEELAVEALAASTPSVEPSAEFRASVFELIGRPAPAVAPVGMTQRAAAVRRPRRTLRPLVALASVAAAAALIVGGVSLNSMTTPPLATDAASALATVTSASDAHRASATFSAGRASVTLVSSASVGRSVAIVSGAPRVPAGRSYTLWYIRDGHATAAGTFEPSADGRTVVALTGTYRAHDVVAATVEPSTGSTQPTTPPVFEVPA